MSGARARLDGRWAALGAVNLSALIFGCSALYGKLEASPVWIVAGRSVFAALALLAIALVRRTPLKAPGRQGAAVALTGALLAAHWTAFFGSVQAGGVAIATLTVSTFPLVTVAIEAARRRRLPGLVETGAALAIIAAIALISSPTGPQGGNTGLGIALGLGAAATFAVFALMSQHLNRTVDSLSLSFQQNLVVAVVLAPALAFTQPVSGAFAWAAVGVLGVVGTALAHQLYLFGLKRLPAAVCGAVVSIEPVYAILLAAAFFAEPLNPAVFVSAAMIIAASLVLMRRLGQAPAAGAEPGG